jgi:hypothetical protein
MKASRSACRRQVAVGIADEQPVSKHAGKIAFDRASLHLESARSLVPVKPPQRDSPTWIASDFQSPEPSPVACAALDAG